MPLEDYAAYNRRRWGGDGWTQSLRRRGATVGTPFADWRVWPNTLRAHRLMRLAGPERNNAMKTALFEACYGESPDVPPAAPPLPPSLLSPSAPTPPTTP